MARTYTDTNGVPVQWRDSKRHLWVLGLVVPLLPLAGIALHHLVGGFEAAVSNFGNRELLVISLLRRDDGGVGHQREVNTGIRHLLEKEGRKERKKGKSDE